VTVTVDINVLLDVFQKREPHYAASARILALVQTGKLDAVFPSHGFTTLYYLVRKHASRVAAETAMDEVLKHFKVGNLDAVGWVRARSMAMPDFEDAVVAVVAEQSVSRFIITRNSGDFTQASVSAITPIEFLSRFAPLS
jgi:predicted nucleic acid-binding protein